MMLRRRRLVVLRWCNIAATRWRRLMVLRWRNVAATRWRRLMVLRWRNIAAASRRRLGALLMLRLRAMSAGLSAAGRSSGSGGSRHEEACKAHRARDNQEFHFVVVHITPCLSPLLRSLTC